MSLWDLLAAPLAEAALLVGIHTWLGLHILRRGVIFVDLALAQVAALGGLVALLVGLPPGSGASAAFALVFALLGAALLAALRPRPGSPIPHEALIGLVYALAAALAILVMARAPEGAHHLSESLSGGLLWVSWRTVWIGVAVYGAVAVVHLLGWRQLVRVSEDPEGAAAAGLSVGRWDLVFYGTFAVVVTHSVATAGVLLVFVFLVAPATLAMMITTRLGPQLLIGWAIGLAVCASGLGLSAHLDLPGGPTVVGVYSLVLGGAGLVRWLGRGPDLLASARRLGAVVLVLGLAGAALTAIVRHAGEPESHHRAGHHSAHPAHESLLDRVSAADLPEEKVAVCAGVHDAAALRQALAEATEPLTRIALARCLLRHDPHTAGHALDRIAQDPNVPPFLRMEAESAEPVVPTR